MLLALKLPASSYNEYVTNEVVIKLKKLQTTLTGSGAIEEMANIGRQVGTGFIMLRKPGAGGNKRCGYVLGISFVMISIALL